MGRDGIHHFCDKFCHPWPSLNNVRFKHLLHPFFNETSFWPSLNCVHKRDPEHYDIKAALTIVYIHRAKLELDKDTLNIICYQLHTLSKSRDEWGSLCQTNIFACVYTAGWFTMNMQTHAEQSQLYARYKAFIKCFVGRNKVKLAKSTDHSNVTQKSQD